MKSRTNEKTGPMGKISKRSIALFILVFAGMLIVTAPATLLSRVVESASNGQFVLANATGTVWSGSASPALRQHSGSLMALEKLHWNISILPLFTGKLVTELKWDNVEQSQPMLVTASFAQVELRNAIIPLQAGVLGELAPMLQPAQLSGQMQIKGDLFTLAKSGINGDAVADWLNAGSVLSAVNPLGSYRLNLKGAGERLDVSLMTLSGALILEGNGSFSRSQGVKFQATARASESSKDSLRELLNNFGPETSPGVRTLNIMR
jgi:general secretion pathway protein N